MEGGIKSIAIGDKGQRNDEAHSNEVASRERSFLFLGAGGLHRLGWNPLRVRFLFFSQKGPSFKRIWKIYSISFFMISIGSRQDNQELLCYSKFP